MSIPKAFLSAAEAAERLGLKWSDDIEGCVEFNAPPYAVAINGDREVRKTSTGSECPAQGVCVTHENGWPVAVITINGGIFTADEEPGQAEREFIEACERVVMPGQLTLDNLEGLRGNGAESEGHVANNETKIAYRVHCDICGDISLVEGEVEVRAQSVKTSPRNSLVLEYRLVRPLASVDFSREAAVARFRREHEERCMELRAEADELERQAKDAKALLEAPGESD